CRYRIEVGWNDGVKVGNIVGAVANEGGIAGECIGPIKIHDAFSTVDLPEGMPEDIFQTLHRTRVAGKQLRLSLDNGNGGGSRPRPRPSFRSDQPRTSTGNGSKSPARGTSFAAGKRKKRKFKAQP
ncbi:MAG: DbpA RNA binding domain-containing protein, partial [Planctomycetota bacterium]|nr:DbpA RNA binding domain-containing protein [Planctomycetota bacterium]